MAQTDQIVFCPLGGLGEIGMNAALYGFGRSGKRKWILVDCGVSFAGPEAPGIDLVLPDLAFVEEVRADLLGIVITHAHEDHFGALAALWPRLRAPVYCTRFAAGLLEARKLGEPGAPKIPLHVMAPGQSWTLGPFQLELLRMAHSIPESCGLAITTASGTVLHTGDWKIDETPHVGWTTDMDRLAALGEAGVLAMVCDSTNVLREGTSPSESDVARELKALIVSAPGRVAVTTFSSNVARLRAVAEAAAASGRELVMVGRAMERVFQVARECGYLNDLPEPRSAEMFGYLPRHKVVALMTGSQGEPRAALSRIADDDHREITLGKGDRVIFSSRTIPGNEKAVGRILNTLALRGVELITDRTHMVHVSGHPRRGEMEQLYRAVRPRAVIPAHGEPLHLVEHAAFARAQGVADVEVALNGDMMELGTDGLRKLNTVRAGRLYQDGQLLINAQDRTIADRRKLGFAGVASVALAIDDKGQIAGEIDVTTSGFPLRTRDGDDFDDVVADAVLDLVENMPKARRKDRDGLRTAIEKAVRGEVAAEWGKKPMVHVLIVEV